MFDEVDHAQEINMALIEAAHAAGHRPDPVNPHRWKKCIDCGGPIPKARRTAVPGTMRCTFCQSQREGNA